MEHYCIFSFYASIFLCNSFSLGRLIRYFEINTCRGKPIVAYFTNVSFLPEHTKGIDKALTVHKAAIHARKILEIRVDVPAN